MRARWIVCLMVPLALCAAADTGTKQSKEEKKESVQPAASAQKTSAATDSKPAGVPKDAVQLEPNVWKWTDPQGKVWHFRKTPFGVTHYDPAVAAALNEVANKPPEGMKATDAGDEVRFERPTPFGTSKWTKKKTELDEVERRVWERDRPKPPEEKAPEVKPSEEKPSDVKAPEEKK